MIKKRLDELADKYNIKSFEEKDPVQYPKKFTARQDIEISALLTSIITWGKREMILRNCEKLHQLMNYKPYEYIISGGWSTLENSPVNIHRTFFERDFYIICKGLNQFYTNNDSLEELFTDGIEDGLYKLYSLFESKHVGNPIKNSACKRSNLFLRWLVRKDGIVDIGIWDRIDESDLIIPLDTHVSRIARTIWKDIPASNSLRSALYITDKLAEMNPKDPCVYDFALFGWGEEGYKSI